MGDGQSKPASATHPKPPKHGKAQSETTTHSISHLENCVQGFSGNEKESIFMFIEQIRNVQKEYKVPDKDMKLLIINKLTGKAKAWFHSKPSHIGLSSNELLEELRRTYGNVIQLQKQYDAFAGRKWRWDESEKFFNYYQDKIKLSATLGLSESQLVSKLIDGFNNPAWERQAHALGIQKTSILLEKMEAAIQMHQADQGKPRQPKSAHSTSNLLNLGKETDPSRPIPQCTYCKKFGHIEPRCYKKKADQGDSQQLKSSLVEGLKELSDKLSEASVSNNQGSNKNAKPRFNQEKSQKPKPRNFCTNCGRPNHSADICQFDPLPKGVCHNCGSTEHLRNVCPYLKTRPPGEAKKKTQPTGAAKTAPKAPKTAPKKDHLLFGVDD